MARFHNTTLPEAKRRLFLETCLPRCKKSSLEELICIAMVVKEKESIPANTLWAVFALAPDACDAPTIGEEELQQATVKAINLLVRCYSSMKIVLLQNIEAAIADDNTGELETLNELLTAKQKELVKLAQSKKDYSALADEFDRLKEKKQKLLVAKADTEEFKKRISELEEYLIEANEELTEYDEAMVRKYIQEIKIYDDRFKVCFKAGIELDIPR